MCSNLRQSQSCLGVRSPCCSHRSKLTEALQDCNNGANAYMAGQQAYTDCRAADFYAQHGGSPPGNTANGGGDGDGGSDTSITLAPFPTETSPGDDSGPVTITTRPRPTQSATASSSAAGLHERSTVVAGLAALAVLVFIPLLAL
jgi:hypothetical protein